MRHGDGASPQDRVFVPSTGPGWAAQASSHKWKKECEVGPRAPPCGLAGQPPPERVGCLRPRSCSGQSQDWNPGLTEFRTSVSLTSPGCELIGKQRPATGGGKPLLSVLAAELSACQLWLPLASPPGPVLGGGRGILRAGGPSRVMRPSQRFAGLTM